MKNCALLALALVLLFATTETQADGVCGNPLFQHCEGFFCNIPFLSAPVTKPNTGICPDIPTGGSTCCNQEAYNRITAAFDLGRAKVQATVDSFEKSKQSINFILNEFQELIDNISNSHPELTEQQQNDLRAAYQSILDATKTYIENAVGDWAECARGLLNYWAGLMCFGCSAHWDAYVQQSGDKVTIILDTTTCTEMTGQCVPFFQDVSNYAISVVSAVEKIIKITLTGSSGTDVAPVDGAKDVCQGNCNKYICYTFIVGLKFKNPTEGEFEDSNESNENEGSDSHEGEGSHGKEDSSSHGKEDSSSSSGSKHKARKVSAVEAMKGVVENMMNEKKRGLGTRLVRHLEGLEKSVEEAHEMNEKMTRSFYEKRSSSVTNTYADNGYQATKVGQSSGLDTSVNGASSSISSWMKWLL